MRIPMMTRSLSFLAAVLAVLLATPVAAQNIARFTKIVARESVIIGSTSNVAAAELDISSATDGLSGGIFIRRNDSSYLVVNINDAADGALLQAGDVVAYRPLVLSPFGGGVKVPTGQLLVSDGSIGAPSIGFVSEPTSGMYYDSGQSSGFNFAVAGIKVARVDPEGVSAPPGALGGGSISGKVFYAGRNSSGGGAPGQLALEARDGTPYYFWVDTTGDVRVSPFTATETSGDAGGTIVGTQTSARATKNIVGEVTSTSAAMDVIRGTSVYQFTYKSGAYNGETFFGIITDESPLFGMDRGRSFNPVNAFGATVLALRDLDARVTALEQR